MCSLQTGLRLSEGWLRVLSTCLSSEEQPSTAKLEFKSQERPPEMKKSHYTMCSSHTKGGWSLVTPERHSTARNGSCCGSICASNSCMESLESFKGWTPPKSLPTECTNHISHPSFPPPFTQPEGHKLQHLS